MSDWGSKLQTKLFALSETSSEDSCVMTAIWIGVHRSEIEAFCPLLVEALKSVSKQVVVLNVINELLLLCRGNATRDLLADMKLVVGEQVLLPCCDYLTAANKDKVLLFLKDWEDAGAFSQCPTLTDQLCQKITGKQAATGGSESTSPQKELPVAAPAEPNNNKAVEDESTTTATATATSTAEVQSKAPTDSVAPSSKAQSSKLSSQQAQQNNKPKTSASATGGVGEPQQQETDSPFDFESPRGMIPAASSTSSIDPAQASLIARPSSTTKNRSCAQAAATQAPERRVASQVVIDRNNNSYNSAGSSSDGQHQVVCSTSTLVPERNVATLLVGTDRNSELVLGSEGTGGVVRADAAGSPRNDSDEEELHQLCAEIAGNIKRVGEIFVSSRKRRKCDNVRVAAWDVVSGAVRELESILDLSQSSTTCAPSSNTCFGFDPDDEGSDEQRTTRGKRRRISQKAVGNIGNETKEFCNVGVITKSTIPKGNEKNGEKKQD